MNNESIQSYNKISHEMERLSQLITQQEFYKQQLQEALQRASSSESEQSGLQNIDHYFQQYQNPTTKSIPFETDPQNSSQMIEGDSQTINTIYRNYQNQHSLEADKQSLHDDKSTVILAGIKSVSRPQKEEEELPSRKSSIPNYSTFNNHSISKKEVKKKKVSSKNATQSMPLQCIKSVDHPKNQNHSVKVGSAIKALLKIDSPLMNQNKKRIHHEHQHEVQKEGRNKVGKIGKIDKDELHKLQQKKQQHKKADLSSNRKKTKRGLGTVKSTNNMMHYAKMASSSTKFPSKKSYANSSCKKFESTRKQIVRRDDKILPNHQDWQRMEKTHKKLNRVNICKLQENMKKVYDKKPTRETSTNKIDKKIKKIGKFNSTHKDHELKLNFTEQINDTAMKKLIDQKQLAKEYVKQTEKYMEKAVCMKKDYFEKLMKECREASQEAILKIKLVTLILYFFDQFTSQSLLSNQKINSKNQQFFSMVPEQQIITTLLHPKKLIKMIETFPEVLMNDNILSAERINIFNIKFSQINEQLDQELEFFLIKKDLVYMYIHALSEYTNFLVQKQLIAQTKRTKVIPLQTGEPLYGFYSSRSKRDDFANKYIRKNETGNKMGFRCDSDRKITLQDEDFAGRQLSKGNKRESCGKVSNLKKVFK